MHDRISQKDQRWEKTNLLWMYELQPRNMWAHICRSRVPYSFRWLCRKPRESQLNVERSWRPVRSTSSFWISFCLVCFLSRTRCQVKMDNHFSPFFLFFSFSPSRSFSFSLVLSFSLAMHIACSFIRSSFSPSLARRRPAANYVRCRDHWS